VPWSGGEVVRAARTVRSRHFADAAPADATRIKLRIGLLYRHSEADQRGWGTTTPSVQATQRQNPYLGSIPAKSTGTTIRLSLQETIARGLRYNLGLIESEHAIRMSLCQLNGSGPLVRRLLNSRFPFLFCKHLKLNHNTNRLVWNLKCSSKHGSSQ
jgi:hypothetical protein